MVVNRNIDTNNAVDIGWIDSADIWGVVDTDVWVEGVTIWRVVDNSEVDTNIAVDITWTDAADIWGVVDIDLWVDGFITDASVDRWASSFSAAEAMV